MIKEIPSAPGYRADDAGRIYNRNRALKAGGQSKYWRVTLFMFGTRTQRSVHRLVCEAFHGSPPPGHVAAHLNGDSHDNRASNLRWCTHAENAAHKKLHGTSQEGEAHPLAKLTAEDVLSIRADTRSCAELAALYGLGHRSSISKVRRGVTWGHVQGVING
jgi:hypothetical protein